MNNQTSEAPFRVLALDGGGIKGVFTAALLAELEHMTGQRVVEHFDLITGTSTGGIIAIALALGIPGWRFSDFTSTAARRSSRRSSCMCDCATRSDGCSPASTIPIR